MIEESVLRLAIHARTSLAKFCDMLNRDEDQQVRYIKFSNKDQVTDEPMENDARLGLCGSNLSRTQSDSLLSLAGV